MRTIAEIACVQLEDLAAGAADCPPDSAMGLRCIHCGCSVLRAYFRPAQKVLTLDCASCGKPAMAPVIPESAAQAPGSEVPEPLPSPSGLIS